MRNNPMEMAMDFSVEADGAVTTLTMTMDGTYRTTSTQPETEPPAGAQIVDMTSSAETTPA